MGLKFLKNIFEKPLVSPLTGGCSMILKEGGMDMFRIGEFSKM